MPTLCERRPTPTQRTRTSSPCPWTAAGRAPSVNTWISARGSWPTSDRAVRIASPRRLGKSRACIPRSAETTLSWSRVNGTRTRGCTPASITITSAPWPSRPMSVSASRWAWANREGHTSVAFMDADGSMTMATRFAPWPITTAAGRASASVKASSARICRMSSGSRCSRWKNVDASRSRSAGSHSSRLDTRICRRRTFRK